jgi:hypothetical protein
VVTVFQGVTAMTKFNRRAALTLSAAACATLLAPRSYAQNEAVDDEFDGMETFSSFPEGFRNGLSSGNYTPGVNFGSTPPPDIYLRIARIIMTGAPVQCRPIDVAYYFDNVRLGQFTPTTYTNLSTYLTQQDRQDLLTTEFLRLFGYDWEHSHYYNPVVVQFMTGVGLTPYDGDVTPWCAAFANWCISRSQASNPGYLDFSGALLRHGTRSASSGSFRCFGDATDEPVEGDLVVWARVGTENQVCPVNLNNAQGHVGFYVSTITRPNGTTAYRVLGGNQGFAATTIAAPDGSLVTQRDIAQGVSYRTIGRRWSNRTFHSFRSRAVLRGPL